MATIEARGYVNKPSSKKTKAGAGFSTFTLAVKQKNKVDGQLVETKAYFQVTDWKNGTAPEESAFVTVKGYLNVRDYEKDGQKRISLDINAQDIEVAPPLPGAGRTSDGSGTKPAPLGAAKEPWDDF